MRATQARKQRLARVADVLSKYESPYHFEVSNDLVERIEMQMLWASVYEGVDEKGANKVALFKAGQRNRRADVKRLVAAQSRYKQIADAASWLALHPTPFLKADSLQEFARKCAAAHDHIQVILPRIRKDTQGRPPAPSAVAYWMLYKQLEPTLRTKRGLIALASKVSCDLLHPDLKDKERKDKIESIKQTLIDARIKNRRKGR